MNHGEFRPGGSNPQIYSEDPFNEPRGIRTPDNLIKSQVLYRLS